jgi:hypothetical protein
VLATVQREGMERQGKVWPKEDEDKFKVRGVTKGHAGHHPDGDDVHDATPHPTPNIQQLSFQILPWPSRSLTECGVCVMCVGGEQAPILEKYARESSCYYSSARLWDDGIIRPEDSRTVLGLSLALALKNEPEPTKFGVFRM